MFEFTQSIFFWTLINFVLLLFLVHKFALPAFYKMVDDSEDRKNQALADLEKKGKEAEVLAQQYREKMANAEEEVRKILHEAKLEKESIIKTETEKMIKEKQATLANIKQDLQNDKRQFVEEMKKQAVDIILLATKKVLKSELSNGNGSQQDIINDSILEFNKIVK